MYVINHAGNAYSIQNSADLNEVPTAALVETYNELTGKSIKKFENRAKAIERTWELISEVVVEVLPAKKIATPKQRGQDDVLEVLVSENPFREGSDVAHRWASACPQTGDTRSELKRRGLTGGDINWCIKNNGALRVMEN